MPLSPTLRPALLAVALAAPLIATATAPTAPATPAAPSAPAASVSLQDVSVIAGTCANCHGPDGRSTGGIPTLRGVGERHLLLRMQAFKAGTASDATVMVRLMKGYDDAQIQALAQWFNRESQ